MEQINRRTPFPKNASGWVLLYEWKFIVMNDSSSQYKAFWGLDLFSEHNLHVICGMIGTITDSIGPY